MIKSAFEAYGREMDPDFEYQFTALRKTHNQGVFDVYSPDMLRCRKSGVLTGLPDGYCLLYTSRRPPRLRHRDAER